MKKSKKKLLFLLIPIISITLIVAIICVHIICINIIFPIFNPLRRSNEEIREMVLDILPVGTNLEVAIEIIENNEKWGFSYQEKVQERGYQMVKYNGVLRPSQRGGDDAIGVKSIRINIGDYKDFFKVSVLVFIAFDENDELIDVAIAKSVDGL
jgi:hypothetical protein